MQVRIKITAVRFIRTLMSIQGDPLVYTLMVKSSSSSVDIGSSMYVAKL